MMPKRFLILISVLLVISISPAFAQHHSGSLAPPVDFDGLKLALITLLTPEDFTLSESKNANLSIRLFDADTNTNVKSVTYRIQIFYGDNLVANEYFFDEDGKLDLEIKPKTDCLNQELWKCTKYYGEKHPIAGAYYARGDSNPVIQGPVFDKSGQYNIKVSIVGATNPKTMTTKDLLFETFLTIPHKETFLIKTANAQEYPVSIKSYDNKISKFNHDELLGKLSFETIKNQGHINQHESNFKQLIILEKDFLSFRQGYDVDVFIEGIKVDRKFIEFDISSPNENIIRIDIPHEQYMSLLENVDNNPLTVEILSGNFIDLDFLELKFENNIQAKVSWDSKSEVGKNIPFTFSFLDTGDNPINGILFAYSITDSAGKEIWSNIGTGESHIGILAKNGIKQESIFVPAFGQYQLKLILTGQNSENFGEFFISKSDFSISRFETDMKQTVTIPSWIKNSAGWWSEGIVGDQEFVQLIQFLINEKIIKIPFTASNSSGTQEIPYWIKNNAGWWSEGLVDDSDFVSGIQYLISSGILVV